MGSAVESSTEVGLSIGLKRKLLPWNRNVLVGLRLKKDIIIFNGRGCLLSVV